MTALKARHLYKVFGKNPRRAVQRLESGETRQDVADDGTAAVIDASFDVHEGEIFVVMGLSGSGKSTLIRMLNGLLPATSGSVEIGGVDIAAASDARIREIRRSKISMVFQHFALLPHLTVLQNAAYPLEIQGVARAEREERARETLAITGLAGWEDKLPSQLSGGMQQRVGLARALTADTDILLMDEAFSALDPLIRREMQDQLVELQTQLGKTIIFITHDLNEAVRLGDRIAVMRDGQVVQIGTGEEILSNPANDYVARFISDVDRSRVLTASSIVTSPAVLVRGGDGPTVALQKIVDIDATAAYVVDRTGHLLGSVYDTELLAARDAGATTLEGLVHADATAVQGDTPLSEMFEPAAHSRLPLAVVDEENRLVGVVPRVALLRAMAPGDETGGDVALEENVGIADASTPPADPDTPAPAPSATGSTAAVPTTPTTPKEN